MPNNTTKQVAQKQLLPDIKAFVSSSTNFTQGDHQILDPSTYLVRAPTAESEAQYYLGYAAIDAASGKPLSPYPGTAVDAAAAIPSMPGPLFGNVASYTLKTGDSINPGANVYVYLPGSGTLPNQYVSSTGTKPIGMYEGAAITSAASGTLINVLIGARYPNDTLKF